MSGKKAERKAEGKAGRKEYLTLDKIKEQVYDITVLYNDVIYKETTE